jgi:hypothetical protein
LRDIFCSVPVISNFIKNVWSYNYIAAIAKQCHAIKAGTGLDR